MSGTRRNRANGIESRQRIVAAAGEIAAERGYEGTSIAAVSERSGLPVSSIYWHFENKDELIAEVIEHSWRRWLDAMQAASADAGTDPAPSRAQTVEAMTQVGRTIAACPDFLRLGLMLTLERRPLEPAARARFLAVRRETLERSSAFHRRLWAGRLDDGEARLVAAVAMALTDGLFIAGEIDPTLAQERLFALAGTAVHAVAEALAGDRSAPVPPEEAST